MKYWNPKLWGAFWGATALVSVTGLPSALGELVFDSPKSSAVVGMATTEEGFQAVSHQAISDSDSSDSASDSSEGDGEVQRLSKSELLRRERMRAEMRNEDILQERLEELRLRDEKRRTEELLSRSAASSVAAVSPSQTLQEVVVAPVTEGGPSSVAVASVSTGTGIPNTASLSPSVVRAEHSSSSNGFTNEEEEIRISLFPRTGLSEMTENSFYNVNGRYTVGLGVEVGVNDHVSFELGYAFSEYGVALSSANPWVSQYQSWNGSYNPNSFESLALKQNIVDAGLKLHLLGSASRLRPFIGGGAAYSKSFINYDGRIVDYLYQVGLSNMARDYEVNSFLGYLSTGFDIQLSRSVSVGTAFKYYRVLTARENQGLNAMAFTGYPGYPGMVPQYLHLQSQPPQQPVDFEKATVGGSLARSSFFSITAGVSFEF